MRLDWQIKPSKTFHALIVFIAIFPIGFSLANQQNLVYFFLIFCLSLLLFALLLRENCLIKRDTVNRLAWQDGEWFYRNEDIAVEGSLAKQSFNLGIVLLLVIEDKLGQKQRLWLFPDNLARGSRRQWGWIRLSCCFHLSNLGG